MSRKFFGTDGIRGRTNTGAMTAEMAMKVGMAAGRILSEGTIATVLSSARIPGFRAI